MEGTQARLIGRLPKRGRLSFDRLSGVSGRVICPSSVTPNNMTCVITELPQPLNSWESLAEDQLLSKLAAQMSQATETSKTHVHFAGPWLDLVWRLIGCCPQG